MLLLAIFRDGFLLLHLLVNLHLLYKVLAFVDSSAFRVASQWCEHTIMSLIRSLICHRLWARIILHNYQSPACCQKRISMRWLYIYIFLVLVLRYVSFQNEINSQQTNGCKSTS